MDDHDKTCKGMNLQQTDEQTQHQRLELANDNELNDMLDKMSLQGFWIKVKGNYLEMGMRALKTRLPFPP